MPDAAVALLAALIGALVGGGAAAYGSSVVMKRDLLERNRHALLMEDLPAFESALSAARSLSGSAALADSTTRRAIWDEFDRSIRQIKVRAAILGGEEMRLGERIRDNARSAEETDSAREAVRDLIRESMRKIRKTTGPIEAPPPKA